MGEQGKVIELSELPGLIPEQASVALGGGWFANHPMAAVRELVRARRDDLRLLALLGSVDVDLLIGAGALRELTFSMVTLEALGLAQNLRRAVQSGALPINEISALSLQVALEAAAKSVPFLPLRGPVGSDLVAPHPEVYGTARSSFDAESTMMVVRSRQTSRSSMRCAATARERPVRGDVETGPGARLRGNNGDRHLRGTRRLAEIAVAPDLTKIPGYLVDAVVEVEFGAHPCSHVPRYAQDPWEILEYQQSALAGGEELDAYVARLRCETEAEYRGRCLGRSRAGPRDAGQTAAASSRWSRTSGERIRGPRVDGLPDRGGDDR